MLDPSLRLMEKLLFRHLKTKHYAAVYGIENYV